ncbi:MAG: YbaB/EbfC family nucleoid-associated protein [Planctomycetes bacterium]|nr:YbaB/EbfC family nucleoid-associated protein [Planctomycetota bacterium]
MGQGAHGARRDPCAGRRGLEAPRRARGNHGRARDDPIAAAARVRARDARRRHAAPDARAPAHLGARAARPTRARRSRDARRGLERSLHARSGRALRRLDRGQRMNGGFGDMGSLLKQAQQMQRELDRVREELKTRTVEGSAGGGAVRVTSSGDRTIVAIEVSAELLARPDKTLVEDLVLAATRDAQAKAARLAAEAMAKVTGGIQLPGLF